MNDGQRSELVRAGAKPNYQIGPVVAVHIGHNGIDGLKARTVEDHLGAISIGVRRVGPPQPIRR